MPVFEKPFASTEMLGEAFEPEQEFENPDGSPISFDQDYFGKHRSVNPTPGPFENSDEVMMVLWHNSEAYMAGGR
jgi:hypothetical protein